jgi:hypothetical protein
MEKKRTNKIATIFIAVIIAIFVAALLYVATGFGNNKVIARHYNFKTAIITVGGEEKTVDINSWTMYGESIEIVAADGTVYLVDSINCTLIG